MYLTGHVSITEKELAYVNDALINGWDENHNSYIKKFESEFAKYVGVKHARSVSGGTQALTLALATLGIGKGDEVIIPEITYFACSDVVKLLGATPVFVDTDKYWCMDPDAFEKAITPKTKAVMPVWLYGNAPQMLKITNTALEHGIKVVEDACPAVGTFYNNLTHAGSIGDFGCFSFHGAKIMTTGFGGMIVTNNTELYEKMLKIADHGEDRSVAKFWQTEVGYSFDLPNINCAMGLAQLERIEELVAKKRKVFDWYYQRLKDVKGLSFNEELPGARINKVMTSIVLDKDFGITRDEVIVKLRERGIDTRPFFFPISMFPMYKEQDTPNAHHIGLNGINLPSGVNRGENEIDYICYSLKEVLCV